MPKLHIINYYNCWHKVLRNGRFWQLGLIGCCITFIGYTREVRGASDSIYEHGMDMVETVSFLQKKLKLFMQNI